MDYIFTLKILLLVVIGFLAITSWDEVIGRSLFEVFEFDKESIQGWLFVAILSTIFLFALLILFQIEAHDVLGVSETVDTILTGTKETISKGGEVIHSLA